MFCLTIIFSGPRRSKTYLRSTTEQQRVNNIALINTAREFANSVVNNDIDRTIDFNSAIEMAEISISFNVFYELVR